MRIHALDAGVFCLEIEESVDRPIVAIKSKAPPIPVHPHDKSAHDSLARKIKAMSHVTGKLIYSFAWEFPRIDFNDWLGSARNPFNSRDGAP